MEEFKLNSNYVTVQFKKQLNLEFLDFWNSLSLEQQNTVLSNYDYDVFGDCVVIDILTELNFKADSSIKMLDNTESDVYLGYMTGLINLLNISLFDDCGISCKNIREIIYENEFSDDIKIVIEK